MNEEEIIFNKLHDSFKNSVLNEKALAVIECPELANLRQERIIELINKHNSDFPCFKV